MPGLNQEIPQMPVYFPENGKKDKPDKAEEIDDIEEALKASPLYGSYTDEQKKFCWK